MNMNWLTTESFERAHTVISALNTLSIHAKILLAGGDDSFREREVEQAKETLHVFIQKLSLLVEEANKTQEGVVMGADPRLSQLTRTLITKQRQWPHHSPLYDVSLHEVDALIGSDVPKDLHYIIPYLQELRFLLEQNVHADIVGLLGEI